MDHMADNSEDSLKMAQEYLKTAKGQALKSAKDGLKAAEVSLATRKDQKHTTEYKDARNAIQQGYEELRKSEEALEKETPQPIHLPHSDEALTKPGEHGKGDDKHK